MYQISLQNFKADKNVEITKYTNHVIWVNIKNEIKDLKSRIVL